MAMNRSIYVSIFLSIITIMTSAQTKITLTVDGRMASARLDDNVACRELVDLLEKVPINISMSDYGGFEKVNGKNGLLRKSNHYIYAS